MTPGILYTRVFSWDGTILISKLYEVGTSDGSLPVNPISQDVIDDPRTRLIRRAAEAAGFVFEIATTAEEAVGILHANGRRFVLAMIDVNLPSMDGWELRQRLTDLWPRLPIVVMSGAVESFSEMPTGKRLSVLIKPSQYGDFFRTI